MATLNQLIRKSKQAPIRRCFIKRRSLSDGTYETDWFRIDNFRNRDRVLNWGKVSLEIDYHPTEIGKFEVSSLSIAFDNSQGHFNVDTFTNSIWNGFLNRKYTKLKIECGYIDSEGAEVGVVNIFEGLIDRVIIGENQKARVTVLSYQTLLKRYDIADLGFTSSAQTVENIYASIMNQTKVTDFIPFVAAVPAVSGVTIDNPSILKGSYWNVLLFLANITNSIPMLIGDVFSFESRVPTALSQFDFKGFGADDQPDIFSIMSYDDEGADKVRLRFQEDGGSKFAVSSDDLLLLKYLGNVSDGSEVEFVNLTNVRESDKQSILDTLLSEWENPRPKIQFDTTFLVNQIQPKDRITIEYNQKTVPDKGVFTVGVSKIGKIVDGGSGHPIAKKQGAINISSGRAWMVTKVIKDINSWKTIIKAEEVI